MNLLYKPLDFVIDIDDDKCRVIYLENPALATSFMQTMWNQINGEEGDFILSECEKEFSLPKEAIMIINPFDISCNNKKIITKLYQEISEIALDELFEETIQLNQMIVTLLDKLSNKVTYHIDYNLDLKLEDLLKMYNFRIDTQTDGLLEQIIDYLRISHRVLKQKIYIFVNLKMFLTCKELEQLYEFASYEKISLLLLEGTYKSIGYREKGWIIDKDLCIIEVNELTAHDQCDGSEIT